MIARDDAAGGSVDAGGRGLVVSVVSGKGGVGKTNIAANLAVAAARRGQRVLLVDGDLGLANVDVLLGLVSNASLADVLDGHACVEEALLAGPRGIRVLPAASGRSALASLSGVAVARLVEFVAELAARFEITFVDAASGIGPAVVQLAAASTRRILVTTAEPTSLADAYALLKVLRCDAGVDTVELLVNNVRHEREALATRERLKRMVTRFLDLDLGWLGWLPRDPQIVEAVARQRAVVDLFPASRAASRLVDLAERILALPSLPLAAGSAQQARR